jgi:succinate dehydrogenase/fumarate reductase flavoprotein subunit
VQCGGHSLPRTHHEPARADGKPAPVGWDIIAALKKSAEATPSIHIVTGAEATALVQGAHTPSSVTPLHHRGALPVVGVRYVRTVPATEVGAPPAHEETMQKADAVILATGGFGNDHTVASLLAEFAPQLAALPTTNGAFARGDGVKMARAAGAYLEGMEHVQVHPTAFVDPADPASRTKFLGECPHGCCFLLLLLDAAVTTTAAAATAAVTAAAAAAARAEQATERAATAVAADTR